MDSALIAAIPLLGEGTQWAVSNLLLACFYLELLW